MNNHTVYQGRALDETFIEVVTDKFILQKNRTPRVTFIPKTGGTT